MFKRPSDLTAKENAKKLERKRLREEMFKKLDVFLQEKEEEHRQQCLDAGCAPEKVDEILQKLRLKMQERMKGELAKIVRDRVLKDAAARKVEGVEDMVRRVKP